MADIMNSLAQKRSRLVNEKQRIKDEYDRKVHAIDVEIKKINDAMKVIEDAISDYLCPRCGGTGEVRHMDAAGQMESDTCHDCHGTGIQLDSKPTRRSRKKDT